MLFTHNTTHRIRRDTFYNINMSICIKNFNVADSFFYELRTEFDQGF